MSDVKATENQENGTEKGSGKEKQKQKRSKIHERHTNKFVNGVECWKLPFDGLEPDEHVRNLIALEVRDDDVLVAAYPKCGTHWVWEIAQMLVNKTTAHEVRTKEHGMMEFAPVHLIDAQTSPRILNSHLFFAHLPEEAMLTKKTKIIHVVRNPKDTLTSMYYHYIAFLDMTWEDLVEEMTTLAGNLGDQFSYMRQMHEFQQKHPDHPVKLVYYEDLKNNPVPVIKELSDFLEVPATEEFCQGVANACSFATLKKANEKKEMPDHIKDKLGAEMSKFYRKGIIGDWKTHFTVAQNERFDALIKEQIGDMPFTFTYE